MAALVCRRLDGFASESVSCDKEGGFDVTSLDKTHVEVCCTNSSYSRHVLLKEQHNKTVHGGLSAKGSFTPCCSVPLNAKDVKKIVPSMVNICM